MAMAATAPADTTEEGAEIFKEREFLKGHLRDFKEQDGYVTGHFEGDLEKFLLRFMAIGSTSFTRVETHSRAKGHKRYSDAATSYIWEHRSGNIPISFFGVPFKIASSEVWHCVYGSVRDSHGGKRDIPVHEAAVKSRKPRGTIKVDCPANIQVRTINTFPEYAIDISSTPTKFGVRCQKKNVLKKLRNSSGGTSSKQLLRHYVKIPLLHVHKGHLVGSHAGAKHTIDKCIVTKIHDLVDRNIDNVMHVQSMLSEYVEHELFQDAPPEEKPHRDNQRFYPKKKDVENHIFRAKQAQKYSKNDQEALQRKVEQWKSRSPQTMIFYRASTAASDSEEEHLNAAQTRKKLPPLLFVHQEPWQMRLLSRYGTELVFLDGVHNTTKYSLPLYFIYVKTNMGLKVVAEFIIQNESQDLIREAISVVKSWNPAWNPSFWVTGVLEAEISAIEDQFPEAIVYISDFHLLKEWQKWMQLSKNNLKITEQEDLLTFLNSVSKAKTEELFSAAVGEFQELPLYKDKGNVQRFVDDWLSCAFRWTQAVRHSDADNIINADNGIKEQSCVFSYQYLPWTVDRSVYGIALLLLESLVPDSYRSYMEMNTTLSQQVQDPSPLVPPYLHHRPPSFVKHCLKAQFKAEQEYKDPTDVVCVDYNQGEFNVRSSSIYSGFHQVQFEVPCCSCDMWQVTRFPCEHFHAVFKFVEQWPFVRLPAHYRNSPFISIDTEIEPAPAVDPQVANALLDHDYVVGPSSNHTDILSSLKEQIQEKVVSMAELLRQVNDVDILKHVLTKLEEVCSSCEKANTPQDTDVGSPVVKKPRLATGDDCSQRMNGSSFTGDSDGRNTDQQIDVNRSNQDTADVVVADEQVINVGPVMNRNTKDVSRDVPKKSPNCTNQALKEVVRHTLQKCLHGLADCKLGLHDTMLVLGPFILTPGDLWTLVPPPNLSDKDRQVIEYAIHDFTPGWLSDNVIDAFLWRYQCSARKFFILSSSFCHHIMNGRNPTYLLRDNRLKDVEMIVVPMNVAGHHWTLLVFDKCNREKLYFDPFVSEERRLTIETHEELMRNVRRICEVIDSKLQWNSLTWPCREPGHYRQQDEHNSGVIICWFARCLAEQICFISPCNLHKERQYICDTLLGFCYSDIQRRNVEVCKVCRGRDGIQWLCCDSCGQHFHAACIKQDYYIAATKPLFTCPQ